MSGYLRYITLWRRGVTALPKSGRCKPISAFCRIHARTPPRNARSSAAGTTRDAACAVEGLANRGRDKALVGGQRDAARDRFGTSSRCSNGAPSYRLPLPAGCADADEAVQDAFSRCHAHHDVSRGICRSRSGLPRILVNGCLDLRKSRARRCDGPADVAGADTCRTTRRRLDQSRRSARLPRPGAAEIAEAVDEFPDRQRTVFTLCQVAEQSTSEVSAALGSARRRFACTCSEPSASCASCWSVDDE